MWQYLEKASLSIFLSNFWRKITKRHLLRVNNQQQTVIFVGENSLQYLLLLIITSSLTILLAYELIFPEISFVTRDDCLMKFREFVQSPISEPMMYRMINWLEFLLHLKFICSQTLSNIFPEIERQLSVPIALNSHNIFFFWSHSV